jgi:hypothetical protein
MGIRLVRTRVRLALLGGFAVLALAGRASAGVDAAEAARLDGDLTPMGAERAGNRDGTIPPWTGGITQPPDDYVPGQWHVDPFGSDEIRFSITAADAERHADHLSDGHRAMFRTYPDSWRMNVYPTQRSASYPEVVYAAVRENAVTAEVVLDGRGSVADARVGPPFPIPRSGVEVVWNHNLRWRGIRVRKWQGRAAVTKTGRARVILQIQDHAYPYGIARESKFKRQHPNVMFAIKSKTVSPQLLAGDGTLVIETIDQTRDPRKTWNYTQAIRRVVRVPLFAYDFPAPNSDSLQTIDGIFLFNGPPDRFDWRIVGKREIYVPYNAYRLQADEVRADRLLGPGHVDADAPRYELHRVWVVEGVRRPDAQHIYSKRVFYVDEDSWNILLSESYDDDGELWRVGESHTINFYEVPTLESTLELLYDLKRRRYYATGLDFGREPPKYEDGADPREFSPNALLYYVR